ncbi:CoA transferase [Candidatus Poriferisodalis sp.]|uniref:CoA transferase n=1 Tax=Candidatus Poriferisodalis sp. TaxID=3101277 RepID=UPI003C6EAD1C
MSDWLPPGLFAYGAELSAEIDCRLGRTLVGDGATWIDMPRRLGTADVPSEPLQWGTGALCVDLGPDDVETWERFADVHRHEADPEVVAAAAQEWRLPVTPYRRQAPAPVTARPETGPSGDGPTRSIEIDGAHIVDLTSMWAGPLCTELLGRAGAEVHKVTSTARPDGLAGSPMHAELNAHKSVVDHDLRLPAARRCLDEMLATADLLVTSLSPRALANLDLLPAQLGAAHPSLRTLAITAFESDSPEGDWIAYGTGVHAASGLGWLDDGPRPPAYSYPDPLAGLRASSVALDQLAGIASPHQGVSLADAVAPLAARAACTHGKGASHG